MTDSGWTGPFSKPPPHSWDYPRLSLAFPNQRKPNLDAHTWLGQYTSGEPASPLSALIAFRENVELENEHHFY